MNGAKMAFIGAVSELNWCEAAKAATMMDAVALADLERDCMLEHALVEAAGSGPFWLHEELRTRVFTDVASTKRAPRACIWREEVLRSIATANVGWAAAKRVQRAGVASAAHVARAYRVPVVCSTQSDMIAHAFADLVCDAQSAERRLGEAARNDAGLLVDSDAADAVMQRFFGTLIGPGGWIRTALEACAASPHHAHAMGSSVDLVFAALSWPTLRRQWWLLSAHRSALPGVDKELGSVAKRWLEIAEQAGKGGLQNIGR